jgi:hypothetical protein
LGIAHVEDSTPSRAASVRREAPPLPATERTAITASQPVVTYPAGPVAAEYPVYGPHGAPCNGGACGGYDGRHCHYTNCCIDDYVNAHIACLYGWLPGDGGCTHPPDYGWTRPTKYPIRRVPVEYHRYWPTRWYGEPGTVPAHPTGRQFPVVFTPTDTTQLGYYYQRVPTWRPNPAMIPPAPWPPDWHHRENCAAAGYWQNGAVAVENVEGGTVIERPAPQQTVQPPEPPFVDPNGGQKNDEAYLLEPPQARYSRPRDAAITPAGL